MSESVEIHIYCVYTILLHWRDKKTWKCWCDELLSHVSCLTYVLVRSINHVSDKMMLMKNKILHK